jgi:hypothetical protein
MGRTALRATWTFQKQKKRGSVRSVSSSADRRTLGGNRASGDDPAALSEEEEYVEIFGQLWVFPIRDTLGFLIR